MRGTSLNCNYPSSIVTRGHKTNDLACWWWVTEQAAETPTRRPSQGDRRLRPVEHVGFKTVKQRGPRRQGPLPRRGRPPGSAASSWRHDTAARIGDDEFVLVAGQLSADHDAARVIDRVKVALQPPIVFDGDTFAASASINVVVVHAADVDPSELLRAATLTCTGPSRRGRGRPEINEILRAEAIQRLDAEGVETPDQRAALQDMGCDLVQGFHLARPSPAEPGRAPPSAFPACSPPSATRRPGAAPGADPSTGRRGRRGTSARVGATFSPADAHRSRAGHSAYTTLRATAGRSHRNTWCEGRGR